MGAGVVTLRTGRTGTLQQLRAFFDGSESVSHLGERDWGYAFVRRSREGLPIPLAFHVHGPLERLHPRLRRPHPQPPRAAPPTPAEQLSLDKTRPVRVSIRGRRTPQPKGWPTPFASTLVHQGSISRQLRRDQRQGNRISSPSALPLASRNSGSARRARSFPAHTPHTLTSVSRAPPPPRNRSTATPRASRPQPTGHPLSAHLRPGPASPNPISPPKLPCLLH